MATPTDACPLHTQTTGRPEGRRLVQQVTTTFRSRVIRTVGVAVITIMSVGAMSSISPSLASADPHSTVDAHGEVRPGNYYQAPENVNPIGGCQFWRKSHAGTNDQAQQDFHSGFNRLVINCGG